MSDARRALVYFSLIAGWILVWFGTITVGLELGRRVVGVKTSGAYVDMTGLWGSAIAIVPLGLLGWSPSRRISAPARRRPF